MPFTNKKPRPNDLATHPCAQNCYSGSPTSATTPHSPIDTHAGNCSQFFLARLPCLMSKPQRHRFTSKAHSAFTLPELWASLHGRFLPECDFPSIDDERSPPRKTGLANLNRQRLGPDWRHSSLVAAIGMLAQGRQGVLLKHPCEPGPSASRAPEVEAEVPGRGVS